MVEVPVEDLLRELAPQVLGAVTRRYGNFADTEDAVQEALLAAAVQWPREGRPDNPRAWLIRVAARRLTDTLRSEQARRRRDDIIGEQQLSEHLLAAPTERLQTDRDDTLILLLLCCHPLLSPASQIALTLRAVGGLTTVEIARAFLVPESTMTRRISRAKQTLKDAGTPFAMPPDDELAGRLDAVQHVLYLIFNEGYVSTSGPVLHRHELAAEAIRLTRILHGATRGDPEAGGLLALMLLTDARRPSRTGADGALVPLHEQDRQLWDRGQIAEGTRLVSDAMRRGPVGPYQLQAAIAALHDEAVSADQTDWRQIVALYEVLLHVADNPVIRLNHAVAVAMHEGPDRGLELLERVAAEPALAGDHRVPAVRGHLLELTGDPAAARESYGRAVTQTSNRQQQRYLRACADRLADATVVRPATAAVRERQ